MSDIFSAVRSIGLGASTAALSFGACGSSPAAYDTPEYFHQQQSEYSLAASDYTCLTNSSDLIRFNTSKVSASGANSSALKFYTNIEIEKAAKDFIFGLKNHQVDLDLETKALIAENLWELYD